MKSDRALDRARTGAFDYFLTAPIEDAEELLKSVTHLVTRRRKAEKKSLKETPESLKETL